MWPFRKKQEIPPEIALKVTLNFPQGFVIHMRHHFENRKGPQVNETAVRSGATESSSRPVADSSAGARPEDIGLGDMFKDQKTISLGEEVKSDKPTWPQIDGGLIPDDNDQGREPGGPAG